MAAKTPYLERYMAGEYERVWDELVALGAEVREEPLYSDALAVARETMRRVRHNIEMLIPRLQTMGYQLGYGWAHGRDFPSGPPDPIFSPPPPNVAEILAELEAYAGALPLSLRAFYEVVGAVNFVGEPPTTLLDWHAVPGGLDALYVYPIAGTLEDIYPWEEEYGELTEGEWACQAMARKTCVMPAPTRRCHTSAGSCPSPPMSGTSTISVAVGRTRSPSPTWLPTRAS
jgi:hypothetical protein